MLDRDEIIYLAKQEGQSLVRLESSPGMRFPAHATAMGKMMLALLPEGNWSGVIRVKCCLRSLPAR